MAQAVNPPQDQVLQSGVLLTLKGGMWAGGQVTLTSERFSRRRRGFAILTTAFGLLGGLINAILPEKTDIDIPLNTISEIGRGKMGLKKDVLYIGTADGKSYQLTPNYDLWFASLKSALEGRGATLTETGSERWSVQH